MIVANLSYGKKQAGDKSFLSSISFEQSLLPSFDDRHISSSKNIKYDNPVTAVFSREGRNKNVVS
jgi:hypothetical protein